MNEELTESMSGNMMDTATLGNGCFWCTEAIFQLTDGVISVQSGYSGGHTPDPDYESVCSGETGHAECVRIVFDKTKISFTDLLEIFWNTHDPTTLNRQGNDIGTQYRSVIFYHNPEQKKIAEEYKDQLNRSGVFKSPVVTSIEAFERFYAAENYHQNYYKMNGRAPYCQYVIRPKVEKFRDFLQTRNKI